MLFLFDFVTFGFFGQLLLMLNNFDQVRILRNWLNHIESEYLVVWPVMNSLAFAAFTAVFAVARPRIVVHLGHMVVKLMGAFEPTTSSPTYWRT